METQQKKMIGRLLLERLALRSVCACLFYDLSDNLDSMSAAELGAIAGGNYDCPSCGQKGGVL